MLICELVALIVFLLEIVFCLCGPLKNVIAEFDSVLQASICQMNFSQISEIFLSLGHNMSIDEMY